MANVGPISISGNVSNMRSMNDIVRFLSAFSDQVTQTFNAILSVKSSWGAIGLSGTVSAGSSNFSCSLVSTGTYFVLFRQSRLSRPSVTLGGETFAIVYGASISNLGFFVLSKSTAGTLANVPFSFNATGSK